MPAGGRRASVVLATKFGRRADGQHVANYTYENLRGWLQRRLYAVSDRNNRVLCNLQRIVGHGRLGVIALLFEFVAEACEAIEDNGRGGRVRPACRAIRSCDPSRADAAGAGGRRSASSAA